MQSVIAKTIHLPLTGGLGLLLFFVLFSSGSSSNLTTSNDAAARLPTVQPTYVHASAVATVAPVRDWTLEDPEISADAALVIDDISGTARPLFVLNSTKTRPLASIVKLLTALTAVSRLNLDETIVVTWNDIAAPENAGGLYVGETMTVRDLLAALLIESSNDAAHALARTAGNGSIDDFVRMMNEYARSIGLHSLVAADPMGVSSQTTTTSLDAARLLQAAIAHSELQPLLKMHRYDTPTHTFRSTHGLFSMLSDITGSKTGFTEEAGQNLVLQRRLPGGRIITSVVLGSRDRETDTLTLHRWVERAFQYQQTTTP